MKYLSHLNPEQKLQRKLQRRALRDDKAPVLDDLGKAKFAALILGISIIVAKTGDKGIENLGEGQSLRAFVESDVTDRIAQDVFGIALDKATTGTPNFDISLDREGFETENDEPSPAELAELEKIQNLEWQIEHDISES